MQHTLKNALPRQGVFCGSARQQCSSPADVRGGLFAYSVLTHEEIVDLLWTDEIQPLLLHRFPHLSAEQFREAHAYAYGGSVIQDLGYYPFGDKEFSNLVHY